MCHLVQPLLPREQFEFKTLCGCFASLTTTTLKGPIVKSYSAFSTVSQYHWFPLPVLYPATKKYFMSHCCYGLITCSNTTVKGFHYFLFSLTTNLVWVDRLIAAGTFSIVLTVFDRLFPKTWHPLVSIHFWPLLRFRLIISVTGESNCENCTLTLWIWGELPIAAGENKSALLYLFCKMVDDLWAANRSLIFLRDGTWWQTEFHEKVRQI